MPISNIWSRYERWSRGIDSEKNLNSQENFLYQCRNAAEEICDLNTPPFLRFDPSYQYQLYSDIVWSCEQQFQDLLKLHQSYPNSFFFNYDWAKIPNPAISKESQYLSMVRSEGQRAGLETAEKLCPPSPPQTPQNPVFYPGFDSLLHYSERDLLRDVRARLRNLPQPSSIPVFSEPALKPICNFPPQPFRELPAQDWCQASDPLAGIPANETLELIGIYTLGASALVAGIWFFAISVAGAGASVSSGTVGGSGGVSHSWVASLFL